MIADELGAEDGTGEGLPDLDGDFLFCLQVRKGGDFLVFGAFNLVELEARLFAVFFFREAFPYDEFSGVEGFVRRLSATESEVGGADIGVEFEGKRILDALLVIDLRVDRRMVRGVLRVGLRVGVELLKVGELVPVGVLIENVRAADLEAVIVEPYVVHGRADELRFRIEDGNRLTFADQF